MSAELDNGRSDMASISCMTLAKYFRSSTMRSTSSGASRIDFQKRQSFSHDPATCIAMDKRDIPEGG